MSMDAAVAETAERDRSLAAYLRIGADNRPHLEGVRCEACHEVMVGTHRACPKCATVGALKPVALSDTGALYSYAIVHRSFPGVKTPIVSAIVRLDDGAFVRGNLEGVEPKPEAIAFDMPVRIAFDVRDAGDDRGGRLVRPVFVPA